MSPPGRTTVASSPLARAHCVIRAALRTLVHAERVVAGQVGVRTHTADDHVTADPGLLRRGDQLNCTAVVHRLFPRRPTSGTGARGEHDGIGAGYRLGDVVLACVLEVNHLWLGACAP